MTKVLYPGSFDPITKGHMNIIEQASFLFDEVYIGVLKNSSKGEGFFPLEERIHLIRKLYQDKDNIKVITGEIATDLALLYECSAMIRGLRDTRDFEEEKNLAEINRDISDGKVNTICLFSPPSLSNVSSSVVREVFALGKDISKYVDPIIQEKMLVKRR